MDCEHSFITINDYLMCSNCYFIQYITKKTETICCDKKYIVQDNNYLICINCGIIENNILFNTTEVNKILFFKSTLFYKRRKYIKKKLDLMTEKIKIENHEEFDKIINLCSSVVENDPLKIITILQKHKLTKYKKYYYYIYYVLFNKKLINLSLKNKNDIINLFMNFEKELNKYNIKYLNSYNLILRIIMKQLKIEDFKNILIAKTCSKNIDLYELILKNI